MTVRPRGAEQCRHRQTANQFDSELDGVGVEPIAEHRRRPAAQSVVDLPLERNRRLVQRRVGAGGHPQLEGRIEQRAGEGVGEHFDAPTCIHFGGEDLLQPLVHEMFHGGHHQRLLGREMVQLRAARHPRPTGDALRGGAGVPEVDQGVDGRVEQLRAHRRGPLGLRAGRLDYFCVRCHT